MVISLKLVAHWPQWQAAITLSLATLVAGFARGWSSPYIAQLTASDCTHPLKLTGVEASWLASLLFLGRLFGSLIGAALQEFIGRKNTLLYSGGPFVLGWVLIIIAPSVSWLYASRLLCGISMGMLLSSIAPFLGEIADPKIRGTLIVMVMTMSLFGTFVGNTMGTFLTLEMFSYVSLTVSVLFIVLFFFVPESAYHQIATGNMKKAEESLQWYTRRANVQKELHDLCDFVGNTRVSFIKRLKELAKPEHRNNMIIICCLNIFIFCGGENVLPTYAQIILTKCKTSVEPSTIVIALSLSNVVSGFIATIFIDKLGRRPLLMVSGLGICTAQILLGLHFHMLSLNFDSDSISWLSIVALFFDYISNAFGVGPVPHALIGELFPPILKSLATLIFAASGALLSFVVTKSFEPYINLVGEKYVFWSFAISAMCLVVFTYFCVSENKKMSLRKIQEREISREKLKELQT